MANWWEEDDKPAGKQPQLSPWERFKLQYLYGATNPIGGGGAYRGYRTIKGDDQKEISQDIRRTKESISRRLEEDDKAFENVATLSPANIGRHVVDIAGNLAGGVDPTYPLSWGKNVITRIASQAGINAGANAASQGIEIKQGVRDDFDPKEVAINAAAGGVLQGGGEVARHIARPRPRAELSLDSAVGVGDKFGTVTSTIRTPARNKKVGGAKNSYHLRGQAIDIARGKGVTHKQIERAYKRAGFDIVESLDEGDHSHFAFRFGSKKPPTPSNDEGPREVWIDPAQATYKKWDNAEKDITDGIAARLDAIDQQRLDSQNDDLLARADDDYEANWERDHGDDTWGSDGEELDAFGLDQRGRALNDEDSELAQARLRKEEEEIEAEELKYQKDLDDNYWMARTMLDHAKKGNLTEGHVSSLQYTLRNLRAAKEDAEGDELDIISLTERVIENAIAHSGFKPNTPRGNSADKHIHGPKLGIGQRDHYSHEIHKLQKTSAANEAGDTPKADEPSSKGIIKTLKDLFDDESGELRGDDEPPAKFPKTLKDVANHPWVESIDDGRGYGDPIFINLKPGYEWSDQGSFSADTVRDAIRMFKNVAKRLIEDDSGELRGDGEGPNGEDIPAIQKLREVLNNSARPLADKQHQLTRKARSSQARRGKLAMDNNGKGEAGFYEEMAAMRGAFPKVEFESIRDQFTQEDLDSLFRAVATKEDMSYFDKVNARKGLAKLFGEEGGEVPTRAELDLLEKVFPKDIINALNGKRPLGEALRYHAANSLNLPRALMATADLSAPGRQGIFLIGRKEFWTSLDDMIVSAFSEAKYHDIMNEIKSRPTYRRMDEFGLALSEIDGPLHKREEQYMTNLAEKLPIWGRVVRGSNRAYAGFLNKLRADTFDSLYNLYQEAGITHKDNPKAIKDIARFVNNATGRGELDFFGHNFEQAAPLLTAGLFSPRLMASRIRMLNPAFYVKLDPIVRKEAVKSLLSFGGIAGTVLFLASLAGADVDTDFTKPSSDFLKIKTGDTRFDILGGFGQYLTLGLRLITGGYKNAKGEDVNYGEKYGGKTRASAIGDFMSYKESPIASLLHDFLRGKDLAHPKNAIGEETPISEALWSRFVPMFSKDLYEATQEYGAKGLLTGIPAIFGFGASTYKPRESKSETKKTNSNFWEEDGDDTSSSNPNFWEED